MARDEFSGENLTIASVHGDSSQEQVKSIMSNNQINSTDIITQRSLSFPAGLEQDLLTF